MTDNTEQSASEVRNEKRREAYNTDPTHRKAVRTQNLESYRKRTGAEPDKDCLKNIDSLHEIGTYRNIPDTMGVDDWLCFTVAETAEALGDYNAQAIYRWIRDGQLPPMTTRAISILPVGSGGTRQAEVAVYTAEEVKALMVVLSVHQQEFNYYTKRHTTTKNKLFEAIDIIRG